MFTNRKKRLGVGQNGAPSGRALPKPWWKTTRASNMPFHETNPFHLRLLFGGSDLFGGTCVVCRRVCKWVRSGKTNPFSGGIKVVNTRFQADNLRGVWYT